MAFYRKHLAAWNLGLGWGCGEPGVPGWLASYAATCWTVLDCLSEPEDASPRYEFGRNKTRVGTGRNIFVPRARSAKRGVLMERDHVKLKVPIGRKPKDRSVFLWWGRVAWCGLVCGVCGWPACLVGLACYRTGSGVGLLRAGSQRRYKLPDVSFITFLGTISGWRMKC